MIDPDAVEAYKARKFSDSGKVKKLSAKRCKRLIDRLPTTTEFHTKPWKHQLWCYLLGQKYSGYSFFCDPGTGKSKIAADLIQNRIDNGQPSRALLLVPMAGHVAEVAKEVAIHAPELEIYQAAGGLPEPKRGQEVRGGDYDVVVMTNALFLRYVRPHKRSKTKNKSIQRKELQRAKDDARAFLSHFDGVLCDEADASLGSDNEYTKAFLYARAQLDFFYALTGTGVAADYSRAFWIQKVVDQGETFGTGKGLFDEVFYRSAETRWNKYAKEIRKDEAPRFNRMLRHRSIRISESEVAELPQVVGGIQKPDIRTAVLSPEQARYHTDLVSEMRASPFSDVMDSPWTRARMLTSGYLPYKDAEGESHTIIFKDNPKWDRMEYDIDALQDERIVIFYWYVQTGSILSERLKQKKIPHYRLDRTAKNPTKVAKEFGQGKRRIMIANSAGYRSFNWQAHCRREFFFETPTTIDDRNQAQRRVARGGQKKRVFISDYAVSGTVDFKILRGLEKGRDFNAVAYDGKKA